MPSASTASKQNRSSRPGAYGQMVVSCWPLGAMQIHDITHAKREPRRAIEVEVAAPTGTFRLVAAHFGLSLRERRGHGGPPGGGGPPAPPATGGVGGVD